ncbi:hypothetical protein [Georgenia faecalis]|uniref:Uncharacterized protein n=1 Tax=Georgenia faecalis TaxID=2483799 RepID=A0ABV9DA75_9MICO|nr:hypothetical protein [Georgenia faecalis]
MHDERETALTTTAEVLGLINQLDPYGLEPGHPDGAPDDEYEREGAEIARRLAADGAITTDAIDGIWLRWFDQPLTEVIGADATDRFVARLNALTEPTGAAAPDAPPLLPT